MQEFFKKVSVAYLAGALGGLAAGFFLWIFEHWAIFKSPSWDAIIGSLGQVHWAEPALKGSLWALLIVPLAMVLRIKKIAFGLIVSLIPTAYTLLIVYPSQHHGFSVFSRDPKWAMLVVLLNAVWGLAAGSIYLSHYKA
jgi:hypothetical protein